MKLVAGLGNPGKQYRGTRHNVGFDVVDLLATEHRLEYLAAPVDAVFARWRRADGDDVLVMKPLTFMNLSGGAVAGLARYYRIETPDLLIVCDDVNLPLGRLRVRATGTEGGHNGLRSVAEVLGTIDYPRLRIGVGRGDVRRELGDHVLARFEPEEQPGIEAAIARAADAVETWIADGVAKTMNVFNRAEDE
ncbi:MAG TPA: aminoacyl-tRNA hydrolase [Vicinamibacterales bacterium]|nr:aminoacyl-tRNA hydrolase [Vicinamibacterales bacterium]